MSTAEHPVATSVRLILIIAAVAVLAVSPACKEVPLTAPAEATFTVVANPTSIGAVGGRSTITVTAFKAAADGGGTVADGTQFFFATNLGVIDERAATENGIARATLQSDGRSGEAIVSVTSGSLGEQTVTVQIGAGTDGDIVITVTANPALLGPFDFTSEIVATVTDNRGNLLADVPVIFSTDNGALASQGAVLRTNANGQAFDRLTFLDDGSTSATVTVTSGSVSGSVVVSRGSFDPPLIDAVSPSTGSRGVTLDVTIAGQNFQPGATVSFGAGVRINNITFVNSETLVANITVDSTAPLGTVDVIVTNPDQNSGTFTGGFEIVSAGVPVCRFDATPNSGGSGASFGDPILLDSTFVAFDASASFDPDGAIASWDWDFGDGDVGSGEAITHDYFATTAPGDVLPVILTVTDGSSNTCTVTKFVEVP